MAALRRQVLHGHRAWAPAWARLAAQPRGAPSRTAASSGGGRGVSPPVQTLEDAQEPGCGVRAPPCPLEKQSGPAAPGPGAPGEVAGALLDMGFSDEHIRGLLSVWPGAQPRQLLDVVSELILLGVNPEPACAALRSSPHLLALPAAHVKRRSSYLRRLGLGEGKLKTLLLCCPEVFTMHQRDIDSIVGVLKDKCLFTGQQVTRILHRCPYVLREDPGDLEYKFQYAYFRMGVKHADVVRTDFLQYSITKIKQRHVFLERLGRYQTPDKKGQTQIPNPLLKDILRVSEAEFLARTAHSSAEEFEVFKKLFAREEEEESERQMPDKQSLSLDEEDEEEEEEEDEDEEEWQ
ncbi:transcription termination factor 4, mitochondrial isoform X2 [Vulpes lagopus]|uniref:transcription termination factor 4, mitochondrial isoform X2 n=1 Tax=Vulpes lagopus TaxID=494514 RepID=UPI001BC9D361|nr:transcription termination factor 4, mitochondrial isoform X2 [Vulpes lagopus]